VIPINPPHKSFIDVRAQKLSGFIASSKKIAPPESTLADSRALQ
jgi:hypothetical protein